MTAVESPRNLNDLIQSYGPGTSIVQLSKRFGIPKRQVAALLHSHGLVKTREKPIAFSGEEIAALYKSGLDTSFLMHRYHVRSSQIAAALKREGITPNGGARPGPRIIVDVPLIVQKYMEGSSINAIAHKLGINFTVVKHRLLLSGVKIRTQTEANRLVSQGHKSSWVFSQAKGHQRGLSKIGQGEQTVAFWLLQRGLEPTLQFAWENYNIDIAVLPVAVEVHRSASFPLHRARDRRKLKDLTNAGIHVIWVWFNNARGRQVPLREAAADYIVAFLKEAQADPSPIGQYRVIRGTAELVAEGRGDFDDFPFVPAPTRFVKLGQN